MECFWNIYLPFQTLQDSVQGHRVKKLKKKKPQILHVNSNVTLQWTVF